MNMLALEGATPVCSVALITAAGVIDDSANGLVRAEVLLAMVKGLLDRADLRPADLDAIAFGRGPGSFTGLRVVASLVQGIAFAADIPVVPVSSLQALAQAAPFTEVMAAIDARREEVYYGYFKRDADNMAVLVGQETLAAPASVHVLRGINVQGVGTGWDHYADALQSRLGLSWHPHCAPTAQAILAIAKRDWEAGRHVHAASALPVYLRDDVVQAPPALW